MFVFSKKHLKFNKKQKRKSFARLGAYLTEI